MKKFVIFGVMLIAFITVASSVQAKELWVGAAVLGELVHGTQIIDFVYHPDARVSFSYSLDGSHTWTCG